MKKINKEFNKYIINFFSINNDKIKKKYEHTYRVINYAKQIATSENLNKHDYNLAITCSLLHDIARFKQIKKYNTFKDSISFDHGDEGYNILIKNNYIDKYTNSKIDKNIILKSVKNHNKLEIDNNLTKKELYFAKLVRDADKLDIIITQSNQITDNSNTINKNTIKAIKNKQLCPNQYVTNQLENLIRNLALIYDLNFKESYRIIKKSNIIDKKLKLLENHILKEELEEIKNTLSNYIEEKISI